ncbi:hypothetical protein L9F63_019257, partial [Diploptera punctata]
VFSNRYRNILPFPRPQVPMVVVANQHEFFVDFLSRQDKWNFITRMHFITNYHNTIKIKQMD